MTKGEQLASRYKEWGCYPSQELSDAIDAVIAEEREACAKIALSSCVFSEVNPVQLPLRVADAIRSRGKTEPVWCEHCRDGGGGFTYVTLNRCGEPANVAQFLNANTAVLFCPICGKPRPK